MGGAACPGCGKGRRRNFLVKILRYGDRGSLVSLLQKGLKRAGFELEVDGVFGEETRRQLTRFQRREGLT